MSSPKAAAARAEKAARTEPERPDDERVERVTHGGFVDSAATPSTSKVSADKAKGPRGPPPPRLGYSVDEFCASVGISVSYFYELQKEGKAPRAMLFGVRRIISIEEAERWCRERTISPVASIVRTPGAAA
jgi:hypothetical protein